MHGLNGETLLDTCGTGGDGAGTFNISTVAAFVVAGAGVHVAKHGNRVVHRAAAAAPTCWKSLGIDIAFRPASPARAIREVGIGFLFAPGGPHRHEARPAGAPGSEDAHRVQPAGAADQPGRRRRRNSPARRRSKPPN